MTADDATASTLPMPRRRERRQRLVGFVLMGVAGWVDACAIIVFANLFVSFQSGDAVQVGTSIVHGEWSLAAKFLGAQIAFVVGAGLGRYWRTSRPAHGRRISLVCAAALLALTALCGKAEVGVPAYAFAAVAMGMQNATMTHEAGVPIGTMVTGTLARLGYGLSDRLRGRKEGSAITDNIGQWLGFLGGALLGAWVYDGMGAAAFWIPAVVCLLLIPLVAERSEPPRSSEPAGPEQRPTSRSATGATP